MTDLLQSEYLSHLELAVLISYTELSTEIVDNN